MGVDYKLYKQRVEEQTLIRLLKEGHSYEFIISNHNFKFQHWQLVNSIAKGYASKERQILETYGGYSKEVTEQIVPDAYCGLVYHLGGELHSMSKAEEQRMFKKLETYKAELKKLQIAELKKIKEEKSVVAKKITEYRRKISDINILSKDQDYKVLTDKLVEINNRIDDVLNGNTNNEEMNKLIIKIEIIESEIIQKNTKLVKAFIRNFYNDLLIESEDLFQVCYWGMAKAVRVFDYTKGNRFSSIAYKYMEIEAQRCFRELTRYRWDKYWERKRIKDLIELAEDETNRKVGFKDLIEMKWVKAPSKEDYVYLEDELAHSDVYPSSEEEHKIYDIDSQYQMYFGDDEILDYKEGREGSYDVDYDKSIYISQLKEALNEVLSKLPAREREVLIYRYGLNGEQPHKIEELSKKYNISKQRVNQIELRTVKKLVHPVFSRKLKYYLDKNNS